MIELVPLTLSLASQNYILAMQDAALLKYTEARGIDWNEDLINKFINDNLESDVAELLGIFLKHEHIGNVRLHSFSEKNKRCEIGLFIFKSQLYGKGLGTLAVSMACEYAAEKWGVSRITADYFAENHASERLFQKAGFHKEGLFLNHFVNTDGSFSHSVRVAKNFGTRA